MVADTFDRDILRMFQNFWRYFGRDSYEGTAARVMRQTYNSIKPEYLAQLTDVLGSEGLREYKMTMTNSSGGEEGGDAGMVTDAIFKLRFQIFKLFKIDIFMDQDQDASVIGRHRREQSQLSNLS